MFCLGLKSSMFLIGEAGSCSSVHIENGQMASVNLIVTKDGKKYWLILPYSSARLYNEVVRKLRLQTNKCQNKRESDNCRNGDPCVKCSCNRSPLHGPGFFPTIEFLQENNIPYYYFEQQARDLVFTLPGVAHAVINRTANVCEARNILPLILAKGHRQDLVCSCSQRIGGRVKRVLTLNSSPLEIPYDRICEKCDQYLYDCTLDIHNNEVHRDDQANEFEHQGEVQDRDGDEYCANEIQDLVENEQQEESHIDESGSEFSSCTFDVPESGNRSDVKEASSNPIRLMSNQCDFEDNYISDSMDVVIGSVSFEPADLLTLECLSESGDVVLSGSEDIGSVITTAVLDEIIMLPSALKDANSVIAETEGVLYDGNFVCELCGKTFVANWKLTKHRRIVHAATAAFECIYCSKKFKSSQYLKQHESVHTNQQFSCTVCNQSFSTLRYLARHKVSHSGLSCEVCGQTFTRKDSLQRHKKKCA